MSATRFRSRLGVILLAVSWVGVYSYETQPVRACEAQGFVSVSPGCLRPDMALDIP